MIPLRDLAHGRAGDKADALFVSVIARRPENFDHLLTHVTEGHCAAVFRKRSPQRVTRYVLPRLQAINFVIEQALDGGVNRSLYLDRHGKGLSSLLLDSFIPAPGGKDV